MKSERVLTIESAISFSREWVNIEVGALRVEKRNIIRSLNVQKWWPGLHAWNVEMIILARPSRGLFAFRLPLNIIRLYGSRNIRLRLSIKWEECRVQIYSMIQSSLCISCTILCYLWTNSDVSANAISRGQGETWISYLEGIIPLSANVLDRKLLWQGCNEEKET